MFGHLKGNAVLVSTGCGEISGLVLLAEELGEGRIVSTDERDFHAYRWKNQHPFYNLLLAQD